MSSIYNKLDNELLIKRIEQLTPQLKPLWGKMTVDQMLSHCSAPMDLAFGKLIIQPNFIIRIFGRMIKNKVVNSKEFSKNSPTAPAFIRTGIYDFNEMKSQLIANLHTFSEKGSAAIYNTKHPFFGPLTLAEWDALQSKHIDHHLRQFGV